MKSRFFDRHKLEGNFVDLDYGFYSDAQLINLLPGGIKSVNVAKHTIITICSLTNFLGKRQVISNPTHKRLKVTCFDKDFDCIKSMKIECACKIDINEKVEFEIIKNNFTRNDNVIAYTFYRIIPESLRALPEGINPFNPIVLIIPDLGVERRIYECVQIELAQKRFSSIVFDLRGVGQSFSAFDVNFIDIVEDYRTLIRDLDLARRKPIVLGHGIGGAIAQLWAVTYRVELRNLILIDTAPYAIYNLYDQINTST
ncbi:MAG TPA: alpha/beta hydrolase, partial [Candidatus Babeliales bacterium]|nr:alpha/beta hydrolase [Candidatus Babeliales bacterium]